MHSTHSFVVCMYLCVSVWLCLHNNPYFAVITSNIMSLAEGIGLVKYMKGNIFFTITL